MPEEPKVHSFRDAYHLVFDRLQEWMVSFVRHLPNLILAVVVLVTVYFLARFAKKIAHRLFGHVRNRTIEYLLTNLVSTIILISGILVALGILNLDKTVTSLLAGAGLIGLGLSFAFQDIAQNFISGISMAMRKPFNIGDTIEVNSKRGVVKSLNLRATVIINSSGEEVIIPNKELFQNALINSSRGKTVRVRITFGISYSEDIEHVQHIVKDALEKESNIIDHSVEVLFVEITESTLKCEARFYINRGEDDTLAKSNAIITIKKALESNHVKLPGNGNDD